jgi:hypothetical protein
MSGLVLDPQSQMRYVGVILIQFNLKPGLDNELDKDVLKLICRLYLIIMPTILHNLDIIFTFIFFT